MTDDGPLRVVQRRRGTAVADGGPEHGSDDGDALQTVFGRLEMMMPQISDLMTQTYFTHVLARSA